ncbi:hypothetical protein X275_03280 [Marinitoga sp. 1197]|uniref:hypothetical protein n=1 Tax=Marinitoga sp. 1197 TaxID=1428449 RepID=UPI000640C2C2|nr:hypothetical protein [Marinitoga sp. 1197]KLO23243.1 hypothetical protein X275_03280 [Marinitoga sp. 1197]
MSNLIFGFIMLLLTIILYIQLKFKKGNKEFKKALKKGNKNLIQNSIRIFSIFLIIGILQNFLSTEKVGDFLLNFSGIKGIITGLFTGSLMMGPPASGYPIAQYLFANNASVSLVSSFLLSWVMLGIIFITYELQNFGKKFTIIRNILAIVSIIIISYLMEMIL